MPNGVVPSVANTGILREAPRCCLDQSDTGFIVALNRSKTEKSGGTAVVILSRTMLGTIFMTAQTCLHPPTQSINRYVFAVEKIRLEDSLQLNSQACEFLVLLGSFN
jgi:hypothetical protein